MNIIFYMQNFDFYSDIYIKLAFPVSQSQAEYTHTRENHYEATATAKIMNEIASGTYLMAMWKRSTCCIENVRRSMTSVASHVTQNRNSMDNTKLEMTRTMRATIEGICSIYSLLRHYTVLHVLSNVQAVYFENGTKIFHSISNYNPFQNGERTDVIKFLRTYNKVLKTHYDKLRMIANNIINKTVNVPRIVRSSSCYNLPLVSKQAHKEVINVQPNSTTEEPPCTETPESVYVDFEEHCSNIYAKSYENIIEEMDERYHKLNITAVPSQQQNIVVQLVSMYQHILKENSSEYVTDKYRPTNIEFNIQKAITWIARHISYFASLAHQQRSTNPGEQSWNHETVLLTLRSEKAIHYLFEFFDILVKNIHIFRQYDDRFVSISDFLANKNTLNLEDIKCLAEMITDICRMPGEDNKIISEHPSTMLYLMILASLVQTLYNEGFLTHNKLICNTSIIQNKIYVYIGTLLSELENGRLFVSESTHSTYLNGVMFMEMIGISSNIGQNDFRTVVICQNQVPELLSKWTTFVSQMRAEVRTMPTKYVYRKKISMYFKGRLTVAFQTVFNIMTVNIKEMMKIFDTYWLLLNEKEYRYIQQNVLSTLIHGNSTNYVQMVQNAILTLYLVAHGIEDITSFHLFSKPFTFIDTLRTSISPSYTIYCKSRIISPNVSSTGFMSLLELTPTQQRHKGDTFQRFIPTRYKYAEAERLILSVNDYISVTFNLPLSTMDKIIKVFYTEQNREVFRNSHYSNELHEILKPKKTTVLELKPIQFVGRVKQTGQIIVHRLNIERNVSPGISLPYIRHTTTTKIGREIRPTSRDILNLYSTLFL